MVIVTVILAVLLVGVCAVGGVFIWKERKGKEELERLQGQANEWKALEAQVRDLQQLRNNLQKQVDLGRQELESVKVEWAGAESQVKSAKTQFKEWNELAEAEQRKLNQRVAAGEQEVAQVIEQWKANQMAKITAELEAEKQKGLRQATEAEALARQRVAELEKRAAELEVKAGELANATKVLMDERDAVAASYAEALRRQALVVGEGGCIRLSDADKADSNDLRRLCRGMRCENAVLKAMYDVYVKPEVERLVREAGVAGVSGIYRIWKKEGDKELSYIGQAVDVGERWKTHAKRAWGVDNTGRIKLYQAMMESGIEEWHWELVEAVPVTVSGSGAVGTFLSEREKYWGGYYAVKEVGLNSKLG